MKSKIFSSSILILFFALFIQPVLADGGMWYYQYNNWQLAKENQQLAAINYENGYEKMILAIDVQELKGERAAWLFPVPAEPQKVAIDVTSGFPQLYGDDIKSKADSAVSNAFLVSALSQVWPAPFSILFLTGSFRATTGAAAPGAAGYGGYNQDEVIVYEHIEKHGITTELVTAKDGHSLRRYYEMKALNMPTEAEQIVTDYTDKDYSFVVSWISNVTQFNQESQQYQYPDYYYRYPYRTGNTLGISVTFPTDKIYFPLKPTSVYGSEQIPILVTVMGHVTPELYPEIQQAQVNYYSQGYYGVPTDLQYFFNDRTSINNLAYTTIKVTTPSKYLKDDLWVDNAAPAHVALSSSIANNPWIFGVIYFAINSFLASIVAGMLVFKNDVTWKKLGLWGLWNFLTLIGFSIATIFMKTKEVDPKLAKQLKDQSVSIWDARKIPYIIVFSIGFLVISLFTMFFWQAIF